MKRRHRSTIVKRPITVIHASIRLSNSIRTINTKSVHRDKYLPSGSVIRTTLHHRRKSKNSLIVSTTDENSKRTTNSISRIETKQCSGFSSESQQNTTKNDRLMESSRQQLNDNSNSTKQNRKSDEKHIQEILLEDAQPSSRSTKINHSHNISNNNMGQKNDHTNLTINDIPSNQTGPVNEYHRKAKEKDKRRRRKRLAPYCCSCSRLCAVVSLFTGLLLGIAIATIIVALLTKSKTKSTVTTLSTSTTTLTTTTTSSTTTATTILPVLSISANDTIYGLWNTSAGGDGTLSTPGMGIGNYVPVEGPPNAFDNNCGTKFTSFGACIFNPSWSSLSCGINTGFYVIPSQGATTMKGLRFCTGNDLPERDPLTMTLEGSNQTVSALILGSSWNLIYNGSTGLDVDPGRNSSGVTQTFPNNLIAYLSYRILITSKRASDEAVQYSELQLLGT